MGLSASSPEHGDGGSGEARIRRNISHLGDRYPFGDAELLRLSRVHAYLRSTATGQRGGGRTSFLADWAAYSCSYSYLHGHGGDGSGGGGGAEAAELRRNRLAVMRAIEGQILPPGFGRRLERAAFLAASEDREWEGADLEEEEAGGTESEAAAMAAGAEDVGDGDSWEAHFIACSRRLASTADPVLAADDPLSSAGFRRLEEFLGGAADCSSRRGARPALSALFRCCSRSEGGAPAPAPVRASAAEFLDLAYSIALASEFLAAAGGSGDDADLGAYAPRRMGAAMSRSLLGYSGRLRGGGFHAPPTSTGPDTVSASASASGEEEGLIALDVLLEWAAQTVPCLSAALGTFLHRIAFPDRPYPPSLTPFLYPDLRGQSSAFFGGGGGSSSSSSSSSSSISPLLFSFACMSPSLGGSWHRLYTSESDGLSFNRLFTCLLGYGGPTLLIIREAGPAGSIFGAFTGIAWKESKAYYGNSDCFLFQLSPSLGVYRPRGRGTGTDFMYCNSFNRSRGYDKLAHGIGFGGSVESGGTPRLFISETFDGCVASSADLTFDPGPLLAPEEEDSGAGRGGPRKSFEIADLEVWGVGGEDAVAMGLGARSAQREVLAANIRKARKVDKAQFLDDFKSGLIESKAFQHRTEARGRHDFEADDEGKGYHIEMDKRTGAARPGTNAIP